MLEADNAPVYFTEFMARAEAAGLQFLGEAGPIPRMANLPDDVQEALRQASADLIHLEQYLDFLFGRQFRRTLLCRSDVELDRTPSPDVLFGMLASGCARPESADPDLTAGVVEEFTAPEGKKASTPSPVIKAVLVHLWNEFPRVLPVPELAAAVTDRLGTAVGPLRPVIAQTLAEGFMGGLLTLHTAAPPVVTAPTDRPVGFPPARVAAADRDVVPTARHMDVRLEPLDRFVLRLLDGSRDRSAVAAAVEEGVRAGAVAAPDGPVPEAVDTTLLRLGKAAVLIG
jgi:methyltransferase-like protein